MSSENISEIIQRELQDARSAIQEYHLLMSQGLADTEEIGEQFDRLIAKIAAISWEDGVLYAHQRHNNHGGISHHWRAENPHQHKPAKGEGSWLIQPRPRPRLGD